MGLRINTNVASLNAQRALFTRSEQLSQNMSRLSSGLRIARASDDAAGLGISERMRSQIRSFRAVERNLLDGVSLVQTAEGALGEMHNNVSRIRELALTALNGTLSTEDLATLTVELSALVSELDRVVTDTEFNDVALLSNSGSIEIQSGTEGTQTISIETTSLTAFPLALSGMDFEMPGDASATLALADIATDRISEVRGEFGATQNRLESALRSTQVVRENLSAAESRIRDVDIAAEMTDYARNQILVSAGASVLAQANVQPELALGLLGPN